MRTIVDHKDHVDRASSQQLARLLAKADERQRAEPHQGRAPQAIEQTLDAGAALIKESKGLGKK
ncbi:hypothetical protein [Bradyrhizobium oligotrophicum]|uniref:hypothetical protein n=1 Tax=Bradyrhizobium oligotrophicum TaxID=44255 RepID=UPI003EBA4958